MMHRASIILHDSVIKSVTYSPKSVNSFSLLGIDLPGAGAALGTNFAHSSQTPLG